MLSSQRLWPRSWSFWVAFMISPRNRVYRMMTRSQRREVVVDQLADALTVDHVGGF